jgi:hypothetical protein
LSGLMRIEIGQHNLPANDSIFWPKSDMSA